jgi:hypothetical protein
MKVFVATRETQGKRKNDFNFCKEDELVMFGSQCDGGYPDDKCGCHRAMAGVQSHKATTTFKVKVREDSFMTQYEVEIAQSLIDGGWYKTIDEAKPVAKQMASELTCHANLFPANSILEKRGNLIKMRVVGVG